MQDCSIPIAKPLEILQSCTNHRYIDACDPRRQILTVPPRMAEVQTVTKYHPMYIQYYYRQTSNIRLIKSQNLNVSRLVLQSSLCNILKHVLISTVFSSLHSELRAWLNDNNPQFHVDVITGKFYVSKIYLYGKIFVDSIMSYELMQSLVTMTSLATNIDRSVTHGRRPDSDQWVHFTTSLWS